MTTNSDNVIDVQIREDFFELAKSVGCKGVMSDFVTALNNGGNTYPLFLQTPLTTQEDFNQDKKVTVKSTSYFFDLNHDVDKKEALDEGETWDKWGKLRKMARDYKMELLKSIKRKNLTSKRMYTGEGKFTVIADGLKLGSDDCLYVKCTYTITTFLKC